MATIPVNATVAPATAPAAPAPALTPVPAAVTSVPDKIQQLAQQIQVNATVTQVQGDTITLSSILGTLSIALQQSASSTPQQVTDQLLNLLQSQKPITLVVQPGDPPTQAVLLLPTPGANAASAPVSVTDSASLQQAITQIRQPLVAGATFPAIVLPPNIVITPPAVPVFVPGATPETPSLISGATAASVETSSVTASPVVQVPVGTPLPGAGLQPAASASLATPLSAPLAVTAPAIGSSLPAAAAPLLQPGNEIALHIDTIVPPPLTSGGATPIPLPTPGPNQFLATVAGNGPAGQLILQTTDATLYIKQPIDAPVGTTLLITAEPAKAAAQPLTLSSAPNFPALQQTINALTQIDPALARAVIDNHIVQPNAALPGALLFFMSAFKQGNARGWLGDDAVDALGRSGKFELLSKLMQEMHNTGAIADDPVVGEWRAYPIPLYGNGQFQALNFYVHGDRERDAGASGVTRAGAGRLRFLIDMRMSKIGALQLDGFVQPKKLDMIVRSEHRLPQGLHNELRQTYSNTLSAIDYTGSLNFQIGRQHWLTIQQGPAPAAITT